MRTLVSRENYERKQELLAARKDLMDKLENIDDGSRNAYKTRKLKLNLNTINESLSFTSMMLNRSEIILFSEMKKIVLAMLGHSIIETQGCLERKAGIFMEMLSSHRVAEAVRNYMIDIVEYETIYKQLNILMERLKETEEFDDMKYTMDYVKGSWQDMINSSIRTSLNGGIHNYVYGMESRALVYLLQQGENSMAFFYSLYANHFTAKTLLDDKDMNETDIEKYCTEKGLMIINNNLNNEEI